jgi:membrane protein implicated in regulation of membrane protease activity
MDKKERNIWKNLGLALAATPIVSFIGIIIITLVGALDDAITKIQLAGYWWLILIMAYILSLIYFLYESKIRKNLERKKIVNGLILYWKEQIEKQGKAQPSEEEIKLVHDMLLERFKIWAWFDLDLWIKYFPNEKYSKYLFGIVDNFMVYWQHQKDKYTKK